MAGFQPLSAAVGALLTLALVNLSRPLLPEGRAPAPSSLVFGGHYRGASWWKPNVTLATRTLVESPFARCQVHSVRSPQGDVIPDWLWFDEIDAINVLVHGTDGKGTGYIVFDTTKYAFTGSSWLSPVGGFIGDGESPAAAARREILEELGLECLAVDALGNYRTAANRGAGTLYAFSASGCAPSPRAATVTSDDMEAQKRTYLDDSELRAALAGGRFQEVKWTATVAMALLRQGGAGSGREPG